MSPHSDADRPMLAPPTDVSVADRGVAGDPAPETAVELCVRSLSADVQPLLDETLDRLNETDVDRVDLVVWGASFDPTGPAAATGPGRALADRLEAFRRWAAENDASFDPFFEARTVPRLDGGTYTRVDLPTVTLVEYHEDDLAFVSPCRMGGSHHAVLDRAERLVNGDPRPAIPVDVPERVDPASGAGIPVRT